MPKLLVIDDEPNIAFSIEQVLDGEGVEVLGACSADEGLRLATEEAFDAIILDVRLGNHSGLEVFQSLRRIDPKCLVIFITGHGTADTAIEAMKLGAYDYLLKPLDAEQLRQIVQQGLKISRLMHTPAMVEDGDRPELSPDRLVGSSAAMQAVCKKIGRLAPQDVNILILGESGTGKELIARAIYHHSRRAQAPFIAINCAAIPEALLESELFGHERGAFTGADHQRIGKFEQCNGGTILLDEVGDMVLHTQAKILRLLQEGQFERVGGNQSVSVNVRILAATNQDLERMIEEGRFRKDLYYRIRGATISVPPLRDHREDISELAHYFLFRHNRELNTSVQAISVEAIQLLETYDWPGNVRELQSIIREAMIVSAGLMILPEFLPIELHRTTAPESDEEMPPESGIDWPGLPRFIEGAMNSAAGDVYRRTREYFDQLLILRVLQHTAGSQSRAAQLLGISRVTLRAKLRAMNAARAKAKA